MTVEEFCEQYGFPQPENEYERESRRIIMDTVLLIEWIFGKNVWKVYAYITIGYIILQIQPINYVFITLLTCLIYVIIIPIYIMGYAFLNFTMFVHQAQVSAKGKRNHNFNTYFSFIN